MKLKRLVMLILVITMLVPVTYSTNTKEVSAASTFRIKGYRHSHAALIEWTKVPGATNYKIYRATRKKGKKAKYYKFKELKIKKGENKLTESWFTKYGDNILNTRWFVNVDTDGFEKTQKKYLYNHKKTYKYKVGAFDNNKKCIAVSNTIKVKKYKSRMYEPRYENLYYVNKARYKYKLNVIPWGHQYNKGLKGRAKDMRLREKRREKISKNWHKRPKGTKNDLYKYLLNINLKDLIISSATQSNENLNKGSEYGKTLINGYLNSPGHRKVILRDTTADGFYCACMLETKKDFYDVMSVFNDGLPVSVNRGKTYSFPLKYKKILLTNIQVEKAKGNYNYSGADYFHTSFFNKIKTLHPFINKTLKDKYWNSTNDKMYIKSNHYDNELQKNIYYWYMTDENAKKYNITQLYVNFLNDYVNVLPYK